MKYANWHATLSRTALPMSFDKNMLRIYTYYSLEVQPYTNSV